MAATRARTSTGAEARSPVGAAANAVVVTLVVVPLVVVVVAVVARMEATAAVAPSLAGTPTTTGGTASTGSAEPARAEPARSAAQCPERRLDRRDRVVAGCGPPRGIRAVGFTGRPGS